MDNMDMDAYLAAKAKCEQLMNDYKPREGMSFDTCLKFLTF